MVAWREEAQLTINDLRAQLANLQVSARLLRSRDLALVAMQGGDPQPQAKGHILFDRDAGVWLLYVHDLKALRAGRTYQLWAITPDQQKHPAGTFDPDDAGLGVHRIELPKDLGQIALAAVTDEPRGGSPQPTGQIHIVGKLES